MKRIKNLLSRKMNRWIEAQVGGATKDSFTLKCPWPYLMYEPKKPKSSQATKD